MRLYIGRRRKEGPYGCAYEIGRKKFAWDEYKGFMNGNDMYIFCPEELEKITGLKLAPGEIRKVKRIVIEVE